MSTEITITSTTIDINVTESPITIEAPSGAYPLPTSVYSVFGRTGNVVAAEGDYTLTQLAGVTITSPSAGQALVYNGTSWVNNTETYVGTVTSVAALTLGTIGTDLTSTVANSTTTPVITLNVPTASASNRGALSAANWSTFNAKQPALSGTGFVKISGTTISYDNSTYYLASNPSFYIPLTALSSTATGLTYTNTTGVFSTTAGYGIPTTASQTTWDAAYNDKINSAAVTGTTTKTLTLNQQDGGTVTASWTDDNTDAVTSVFGRTGAVIAVNGDYTTSLVTEGTNLYYTEARFNTAFAAKSTTDLAEGTNLYYTDVRARASNSFVAGSGAYNSTTGVITIPTNNNQITNGAAYITLTGLSATTPLNYNNTTGVFTISQSNTSTNGYLSSTDWNTFNNKESAVTAGTITQYYRGDKTFQILDTSAVPEATNLYYTQARFDTAFSNKTTTNLTEGTNLYYTDTRARAAITGTSPISVTSGVVSISQANTTTNGYLSFTDWNTFNGKQNALNGTGFVKISGTTISYDNSTYLTTIEGIAAGGELSGTYASPSLVNTAVTGKILTGVNVTGGSISATDSILTAFGKVQNQINGLIGGSIYQGTWNANTNTPTLTSSVGTSGYYYIVSVAGATNLNGITDWQVGDWAIFNGGLWQKVDNTDAVVSVNGFTGAVSLVTTNINEGTNLYFTNARTIASILTGYTSGAGTITSSDTILTAIQKLNGNIGSIVSGVSSVFGRTGAVVSGIGDYTTSQVTEGTNLYFTDTRARAAISLTTTGTSGAATYVSGVINIPNYSSALTGYVPYTGATQDVDLGAFKLNAQSLHAKGTGGLGHIGLKHQSASATASANEVSLFADSNGDFSWINGNLYLSKFITSSNTAARSYTFPNATGTIALTSDISYPVTSVFGRTGVIIATSGDYTTTQVTEGTNLYYTDTRARASISTTATGLTYTSGTGVLSLTAGYVIPTTSSATNWDTAYTNRITSATSPLSIAANVISIAQATTSTSGFLSSTDWTTFNNKQSTVTLTTTGTSGAATFSANTLNIPNYGSALSGYLPLTGGTLTGALSGTSATFSGNLTIDTNTLFVDSTNNRVGIGTLSPAYTLDVSGTIRATGSIYGDVGFRTKSLNGYLLKNDADSGNLGGLVRRSYWAGGAALDTQICAETGYGIFINVNGSTTSGLTIASTGAATFSSSITLSGNGTQANNTLFTLSNGYMYLDGNTNGLILENNYTSSTRIRLEAADNMRFETASTERMRITSGGNVLINKTTTGAILTNGFEFNPSSNYLSSCSSVAGDTSGYFANTASSGIRYLIRFYGTSAEVGKITHDGTNTTYATSSDYRLKENIVPMKGALEKVLQLRPCTYTWKSNGAVGQGFIAHELAEVCKQAVVGDKDAVDKNGEPDYQGIDTSFLVAYLVNAIQEQQAQIEELKAEINELKALIAAK